MSCSGVFGGVDLAQAQPVLTTTSIVFQSTLIFELGLDDGALLTHTFDQI